VSEDKPDRFEEKARETFKKFSAILCKWTADKPVPWLIYLEDEDRAISIFAQALREESERARHDIQMAFRQMGKTNTVAAALGILKPGSRDGNE